MLVQRVQGRRTCLSSLIIGVVVILSVGAIGLLSAGLLCVNKEFCIGNSNSEETKSTTAAPSESKRSQDEEPEEKISMAHTRLKHTSIPTTAAPSSTHQLQDEEITVASGMDHTRLKDNGISTTPAYAKTHELRDKERAVIMSMAHTRLKHVTVSSTAAPSSKHQLRDKVIATTSAPSSTHQLRAKDIRASATPSITHQPRAGSSAYIKTDRTTPIGSVTGLDSNSPGTFDGPFSRPHPRKLSERKGDNWPFMASLQINRTHACSATIISPTFLITGAGCVGRRRWTSANFSVVINKQDSKAASGHEKMFRVQKVLMNSNNQSTEGMGVLVLLKIRPATAMETRRQLAHLPLVDKDLKEIQDSRSTKDDYLAVGWGSPTAEHPSNVQATPAHLVDVNDCNSSYGKKMNSQTDICAFTNGTATCHGDGGTALLRHRSGRYILVGVASDAYGPCRDSYSSSVFSNVTAFIPWIKEVVKDLPSDD